MLWLQKTPNGKAGFRHTWRVKWSPSPGRIGQMVAVRLITIACKMEALLLSSLTKRLSFPALLPPAPLRPSSFIDLSAVAAFDESKNALRYLKLKRNVCRWGDGVGDVVKPNGRLVLSRRQVGRRSRLQTRCSDAVQVSWRLSWSLFSQPLAKFKQITLLICNRSLATVKGSLTKLIPSVPFGDFHSSVGE